MSSRDPSQAVYFEVADSILILRFRHPRFTLAEAMEVRDLVYGRFSGSIRNVILNLSTVEYIDSTAISLLVRMSNELGLRITNVSAAVAGILAKMRLYELFYILPSEYEARRSLLEE